MTYSATQTAEMIGTDAKTLRRFLRENDAYRNPGSGKRYVFTAREVESVRRAFASWQGTRVRQRQTSGETRAKDKTQDDRHQRARERLDALETSLKSSGKHISQHQ